MVLLVGFSYTCCWSVWSCLHYWIDWDSSIFCVHSLGSFCLWCYIDRLRNILFSFTFKSEKGTTKLAELAIHFSIPNRMFLWCKLNSYMFWFGSFQFLFGLRLGLDWGFHFFPLIWAQLFPVLLSRCCWISSRLITWDSSSWYKHGGKGNFFSMLFLVLPVFGGFFFFLIVWSFHLAIGFYGFDTVIFYKFLVIGSKWFSLWLIYVEWSSLLQHICIRFG